MAIITPSRQSWFKQPTPFRAQPSLSPFAKRKGASGMPTRHSRECENPEGTGWENHGNHYPIMAIMVQNLPPFAFTSCHSERSEEPPPFAKRKGPGGCTHVIPAQAGIQRDVRAGQHHGNHFKIMAIMVQTT